MCNQIVNQLIILLEQKLELHRYVYLPNVPWKKMFLKHELQLGICILEIVHFEISIVVHLPVVRRNTIQKISYVPAFILLGCVG